MSATTVHYCDCSRIAKPERTSSGWECAHCEALNSRVPGVISGAPRARVKKNDLEYQRRYNHNVRPFRNKSTKPKPARHQYQFLDGMTAEQKHQRRKAQQREAMRKAREKTTT